MNRTEINDLPVPEKELTEDEAKKIQGGIFRPVVGGDTATGMADDLTQPEGQNTMGERDQKTD